MAATTTSKPRAREASRTSNGKRPLPATRPSLCLTAIKRGHWSGTQCLVVSRHGHFPPAPFQTNFVDTAHWAIATDHLLNHPTFRTLVELSHNVYLLSTVRL